MKINLIPETLDLPFMKKRHFFYVFSSFLIIVALIFLLVEGLKTGIDFSGGSVVEVKTPKAQQLDQLRTSFAQKGLKDLSLQTTNDNILIIRFGNENPSQAQESNLQKIKDVLGASADYRRVEFVGPRFSSDLFQDSLISISLAIVAILIYIFFRFDAHYALAAVIALFHDVFLTVGLFSITRLSFDLTSVAALLLIAGYSINDTVVVFDRIRENISRHEKGDLLVNMNNALNQTLSRTLRTSFTTLLVIAALIILGGPVLRNFSIALFFGILIGTYSSICLASPILSLPWFRNFFENKESS